MASPTDKYIPDGGLNWIQLVQHLQNSLHAQDNSIDKNYALIVDKKHARLDDTGPIILKKVKITNEHGEVNKKIMGYMNQDRIVIRTHSGIAFSPSFTAQLNRISNSLQGRVSREQQSFVEEAHVEERERSNNTERTTSDNTTPTQERAPSNRTRAPIRAPIQESASSDNTIPPIQERSAPIMRSFVIRNANNPNEIEEFTAALESMDDETYDSIFGFNLSALETDHRKTEKEAKVEHKHKAPMPEIASAPRQTQPSLAGKLANKEATATMLQQARNMETRRFQEKRKERAAEDKEKRKEIRHDEEKREIKNEEIKKSEAISSAERANLNTESS